MEGNVIQTMNNLVYEEWMIGCKTLMIEELSNQTFYLSQGYGEHRAFLYGSMDEHMYMIYYSDMVSVWN